MGAYEYQALDSRGHQTRGVAQGDTARQVRQALREKGLNPLSVEAISETTVSRSKLGLGRGFGMEEVLATVTDQAEKPAVKKIMASIRARVMEGHSMSAGMAEYPRAFPHLVCATVSAGEQSGQLDKVLLRLADYAETREELGRKVGLALLYPILLTVIALAVVTGLMAYVVPKVTQVFENMQQTLPPLTQALITASDFIVAYGSWLAAGSGLLVLVGLLMLRVENTRYAWHGLLLRMPVVGRLMRGVQTARFSRTLGILTASAVPLLQGLKIAAEVVTNLPMRRAVSKIGAQVREGSSLNQALTRSKQFPPLVVRLVASGEKSGQLDEMLERAADNQEREVETTTAVLMGILELALILVVGLLVMMIVLAIMLPILQMNQLVR
jgi:general secretion pathway protein F